MYFFRHQHVEEYTASIFSVGEEAIYQTIYHHIPEGHIFKLTETVNFSSYEVPVAYCTLSSCLTAGSCQSRSCSTNSAL